MRYTKQWFENQKNKTQTDLKTEHKVPYHKKFKTKKVLLNYIAERDFLSSLSVGKMHIIKETLLFKDGSKKEIYIRKDKRFFKGQIVDLENGIFNGTNVNVFYIEIPNFRNWILFDDIKFFRTKLKFNG